MKRIRTTAGPCRLCSVAVLVALLLGSLPVLAGCGGALAVDENVAKGTELAEQGDFQGAAAELEAALEKDQDNVPAMTMLGVAYYKLQRLDEAIAQFRQAIDLTPDDAGIHSNLAAAYVQNYELEKGLAEYQMAIQLDPELAEAHFGLGVVHFLAGRQEEAVQAFESFQQYDQGRDPTATELAEQYLEQLRGQ